MNIRIVRIILDLLRSVNQNVSREWRTTQTAEIQTMLRSRHTRFKLILFAISICMLMSYFIRNRYSSGLSGEENDKDDAIVYSLDNFVNISWQFSVEAVSAEVMADLAWLKAETTGEAGPNSRAFKRRIETTSMHRIKKSSYLIVEYTNVFFKPKFCDKSSKEIFNSDIEQ